MEGSASLGCTGFQAFRKVTLPLARPGIVAVRAHDSGRRQIYDPEKREIREA